MTKELGAAVKVCPPTVKTDWTVEEAKSMVEPSIMAPWSFEGTEMIWPEMVTGLPPALRMEPLGRVMAFRWGLASGGETRVAPATEGRA